MREKCILNGPYFLFLNQSKKLLGKKELNEIRSGKNEDCL